MRESDQLLGDFADHCGMALPSRLTILPDEVTTTADGERLSSFVKAYGHVMCAKALLEAGCRLGAIKRRRKIDLPTLAQSTVLAMSGIPGTETSILVNYLSLTGEKIAPSAFYDRFTDAFADLMEELAHRAFKAVQDATPVSQPNHPLAGLMRWFSDVRIGDSTCLFLKRFAAKWAKSTSKKRPAAVKLHTVINASAGLPIASSVGPQRTHDNKEFPESTLVAGSLSLFDLGYIDVARFIRATKAGAYFITRLKQSHNPTILSVIVGRGPRRQIVGLTVDEALDRGLLQFDGGVLDLDVELRAGADTEVGRVVATKDSAGEVHWYLTNVPGEILDAADVAETYRVRWLVELFFKQTKSGLGLSAILAWRQSAVRALIYSKLVALALARLLELAVAEKTQDPEATVQLALVLTLARAAPILLSIEYMQRGITIAQLEERLILIASIVARSRSRRREAVKRARSSKIGTS